MDDSFWKKVSDAELDQLEDSLYNLGVFEEIETSFGLLNKKMASQFAKAAEPASAEAEEIKFLDHRRAQNISNSSNWRLIYLQ